MTGSLAAATSAAICGASSWPRSPPKSSAMAPTRASTGWDGSTGGPSSADLITLEAWGSSWRAARSRATSAAERVRPSPRACSARRRLSANSGSAAKAVSAASCGLTGKRAAIASPLRVTSTGSPVFSSSANTGFGRRMRSRIFTTAIGQASQPGPMSDTCLTLP